MLRKFGASGKVGTFEHFSHLVIVQFWYTPFLFNFFQVKNMFCEYELILDKKWRKN
jgi:hypothetical protein